jgi:acyl dehydratase
MQPAILTLGRTVPFQHASSEALREQPMKIADFQQYAGKEIGVSRWFDITQDRINAFADLTEDWQAIHIDPIAAARTSFGGTIAHGFLVLALMSAMLAEMLPDFEDRAMAINYGFDKIRFVSPVSVNARIRGRFTLVEARCQPNGDQIHHFSVRVEIEGLTKPAVVADWLSMERPLSS